MCLWNGFIAAAPGHPILAQIIQTVVNNIRNRFTSLDIMNTLCPDVHFSVSHKYNILFTCESVIRNTLFFTLKDN
jgi:mannosyltransferase OCH1-like enzyme